MVMTMKKNNRLRAWFMGDDVLPSLDSKPIEKPKQSNENYVFTDKPEIGSDGRNIFEIKPLLYAFRVLAVLFCAVFIFVLLLTAAELPKFGSADVPDNNEVSERYIESGIEETGAVNFVAGMILDHRAFDTFGESCVLFSAVSVVFILLKSSKGKKDPEESDRTYEPKPDIILRLIATVLCPIIILFGIYVMLNGHLSPGGGFSGGAIAGAGLILYVLAFGFQRIEKFFTEKTFKIITLSALSFYCLAKSYSFFTGANGLESGIPLGTPGAILSSGLILPLNLAVGLVVTCTMYGFYAVFRKGGF